MVHRILTSMGCAFFVSGLMGYRHVLKFKFHPPETISIWSDDSRILAAVGIFFLVFGLLNIVEHFKKTKNED